MLKPELEDEMRVTVIATGFDNAPKSMQNTVESQIRAQAESAAKAPESTNSAKAANTAAKDKAASEESEKSEPEKKDKQSELISDDDFSEILGILQKNKRDNY